MTTPSEACTTAYSDWWEHVGPWIGPGSDPGNVSHEAFCAGWEAAAPLVTRDAQEQADELAKRLEHAEAALAGSNEGVRLWMLDCGYLLSGAQVESTQSDARAAGAAVMRDWIKRLATETGAVGRGDEGPAVPFADLIDRYFAERAADERAEGEGQP